MAISKNKIRFEISMEKASYELISTFSKSIGMTKSMFIECCCCNHIRQIVMNHEALRKARKEKTKKGKA